MMPPLELLDFLRKEDGFLIATHMSPDGDGLGSALALSAAIETLGKKTVPKKTVLVCKDTVPYQCKFLPGHEKFITFDKLYSSIADIKSYNLVLVDCNDISRLIDIKQNPEIYTVLSSLFSVVIDHHETEKPFGNIKWIEPDAAATGLLVFYLIRELGINIAVETAINLYAAIAVDTGHFRFDNTTSEVLRIAADLVDAGARPVEIYRWLFESWSEGRFELFMKVINTFYKEDGIAVVRVTRDMLKETHTVPDDIEHFVNFPKIMGDIRVSVLFNEIDDNYYKISLRSKDEINVAQVAEMFGGGGHKNAAGCRIKADFETAKSQLLSLLRSLSL
jgi:phosphoesterase RecJ-like protein